MPVVQLARLVVRLRLYQANLLRPPAYWQGLLVERGSLPDRSLAPRGQGSVRGEGKLRLEVLLADVDRLEQRGLGRDLSLTERASVTQMSSLVLPPRARSARDVTLESGALLPLVDALPAERLGELRCERHWGSGERWRDRVLPLLYWGRTSLTFCIVFWPLSAKRQYLHFP